MSTAFRSASDPVPSEYLSAKDAASALGVKIASLYSYVSRGVIRSIQQPGAKAKLYYRDDVERAKTRIGGRAGIPETMETTVRWGQPMLTSSITALTDSGPVYRGRRAIDLAEQGRSFESVAELLWSGLDTPALANWEAPRADSINVPSLVQRSVNEKQTLTSQRLFALINILVGLHSDLKPDYERGSTIADARQLIQWYAAATGYLGPRRRMVKMRESCSIAEILARALCESDEVSPAVVQALNSALIVCADHELSPPTLAARIAASAGADLRACMMAAVSTHAGSMLGGGCDRVELLMRAATSPAELRRLIERLERLGQAVPGFNLVSYPKGDPRAAYLLALADSVSGDASSSAAFSNLLEETRQSFDLRPSIEIGLVGLCSALKLPPRSPSTIWTLGRCAGWVAHVIEQRLAGYMIRPRAKYVSLA